MRLGIKMEHHQNLIISGVFRRLLIEHFSGNAVLFPIFFQKVQNRMSFEMGLNWTNVTRSCGIQCIFRLLSGESSKYSIKKGELRCPPKASHPHSVKFWISRLGQQSLIALAKPEKPRTARAQQYSDFVRWFCRMVRYPVEKMSGSWYKTEIHLGRKFKILQSDPCSMNPRVSSKGSSLSGDGEEEGAGSKTVFPWF